MFLFFLILIGLPLLISLIDFIGFFLKGKRIVAIPIIRVIEIEAFLVLLYLYASLDTTNDCCGDSAAFSPAHQTTILVIVILCTIAYFYSSYRTKISTPIIELLVNTFLILGIVLNVFIAIQTNEMFFASLGNLPIILFAILVVVKNQKAFIAQTQERGFTANNKLENFSWKTLNQQPLIKYPVLFILCLPVLVIISSILLLTGQKPDSIIRAFTDTYKHGFSQWDYKCNNVQCGGHYLCSVAAGGHSKIVKPQRLGIRNGHLIICNRQLLVSNAFEDLIEEKVPFLHKCIRKQYNKVGNFIHRYYRIFNNKLVSDIIYISMKPLEWFFLLTLYTFDRKPENRIAKQYISRAEKQEIERHQNLFL